MLLDPLELVIGERRFVIPVLDYISGVVTNYGPKNPCMPGLRATRRPKNGHAKIDEYLVSFKGPWPECIVGTGASWDEAVADLHRQCFAYHAALFTVFDFGSK